jgi:hypothetical protein
VFLTQPISPETGEHGRVFILFNRSDRACLLRGYPRLAFSAHGHRLPFVEVDGGGGYVTRRRPDAVLLGAGLQAYFMAAKYRCDGQVAAEAARIAASVPGRTGRLTKALPPGESVSAFDYCRRYAGESRVDPGNYVYVTPIVANPATMSL